MMHVSTIGSLTELNPAGNHSAAKEWNRLIEGDNPFVRYEFLAALERTGCVNGKTGWTPQYLVVHADGPGQGKLLGAVPLYLKYHSYGEYVFDWAWANAYARAGYEYYPKLVAAAPFTPATGPRLLLASGRDEEKIADLLIQGALAAAQNTRVSSLHWLFTNDADTRRLEAHGMMRRVGCQFHWLNPGYRDFEDFLSSFTAHKRKKIKRERRYVAEAGIVMEALPGAAVTSAQWDIFYEFYHATIRAHGAIPYLTRDFFHILGNTMPDKLLLVFARHDKNYVAGAIYFRSNDALYGRYWGSLKDFHSLHFETCYYTAIEYCIAHGLKRFEAGAQGEHKLARGFVPTVTYSAHWLRHPQFSRAVADFLAREQNGIEYYMDELNEHSPFKKHANLETSGTGTGP